MKVIKILAFLLSVVLIAQSFLTACPICLSNVNFEESIGEMEPFVTLEEGNEFVDEQEEGGATGFTPYDAHIIALLAVHNNEEAE